jgi:uncharacterized protein (DUF1330 family)
LAAYLVAHMKVHDQDTYRRYRDAVSPLVDRFGGRFRIRGGAATALEGDWSIGRLVVIEFPSVDAARLFYDSTEYQEILPLRQRSASGTVAIVEGVE